MGKDFNLSNEILYQPLTDKTHGDCIEVKKVKEFIKLRNDLDDEFWICVFGRLSSGVNNLTLLRNLLQEDFEKHKIAKNTLARDLK